MAFIAASIVVLLIYSVIAGFIALIKRILRKQGKATLVPTIVVNGKDVILN